jgi:hypothetical protein
LFLQLTIGQHFGEHGLHGFLDRYADCFLHGEGERPRITLVFRV